MRIIPLRKESQKNRKFTVIGTHLKHVQASGPSQSYRFRDIDIDNQSGALLVITFGMAHSDFQTKGNIDGK